LIQNIEKMKNIYIPFEILMYLSLFNISVFGIKKKTIDIQNAYKMLSIQYNKRLLKMNKIDVCEINCENGSKSLLLFKKNEFNH